MTPVANPPLSSTPKPWLGRGLMAHIVLGFGGFYPVRFLRVPRLLITVAAFAFVIAPAMAALPGDINKDGTVSIADISIIRRNFNTNGGPEQGDINGFHRRESVFK